MSLTQHVVEPTHEYGHTLDLVITRESDNLICGRPAPDILFSDHLALLFKLKTARPPLKVGRVSFRKLRSIDRDAFMDEIRDSELSKWIRMILVSLLPYLTIYCVPCWIVMLPLSIRILLVDRVFHE